MVLKVPRLNWSPLVLCDRPFSLLGFGDILVPGNIITVVATDFQSSGKKMMMHFKKKKNAMLTCLPCLNVTVVNGFAFQIEIDFLFLLPFWINIFDCWINIFGCFNKRKRNY